MLAVSLPGITPNVKPAVIAVSLDSAMPDPFSLHCKVIRSESGDRVLVVDGEIDASNLGSFEIFLQEAAEDMRPFVIDMTGVEFVCAGAYSLLMALSSRTRFFGPAWALVAGPQIRRQAVRLGLTDPVIVSSSLSRALTEMALVSR